MALIKYLISVLLLLFTFSLFSQAGAGIRYSDSIPTTTPNPALRHSTVTRDLSKGQLYNYDRSWKRLPNETEIVFAVDSIEQLTSVDSFVEFRVGDRIINRISGANYLIQVDSVAGYQNDTVAVIPIQTNYAVLQPSGEGSYNAEWFGAVGDDSKNNTEELQSAVDYISIIPGDVITGFMAAKLELSPGKTYLSDSLVITRRNFILDGNNSLLKPFSQDSTFSMVKIGNDVTNAFHVVIRDISIQFPNGAGIPRAFAGIHVYRSDFGKIENVKIGGVKYGIYLGDRESVSTYIDNVNISGCDIGIYAVKNSDSNPNASYIKGGKIFSNEVGGIAIDGGTSISISDIDLSLNVEYGIKLGTDTTGCGLVTLNSIYNEAGGSGLMGDTSSIFIFKNCNTINLKNSWLNGANGTITSNTHMKYGVKLINTSNGYFSGNTWGVVQGAHIYADSLTDNILVESIYSKRVSTQYDLDNRQMIRLEDNSNGGVVLKYHDFNTFNKVGSVDSLKNYIDPDVRNWTHSSSSQVGEEYCELINDTVGIFTFDQPLQGVLEIVTDTFPTTQGFARVKFVAKLVSIDDPVQNLGQFAVFVVRNNGYSGTPYKNNIELDYEYRFFDLVMNLNHDAAGDTALTVPYTTDVPFLFRFNKPGLDSITVAVGGVQITELDDDFYYYQQYDTLDSPSYVIQEDLAILKGLSAKNLQTSITNDTLLTILNGQVAKTYLGNISSNIYAANDTIFEDRIVQLDGGSSLLFQSGGVHGLSIDNGLNRFTGAVRFGDGTTTTASIQFHNLTNLWELLASGASLLLDPNTVNGSFIIRNLANSNLFELNTNLGEFYLNGITDQGAYSLQVEGNTYLDDNITIGANSILVPSSTTSIVAGTGITVANTIMRIDGSGGAVDITAVPQIADGVDGQLVMIKGQSDTNTVTLDDGTGLQLAGAASIVLGLGDIITLMYDSVDDLWIEISRSDN